MSRLGMRHTLAAVKGLADTQDAICGQPSTNSCALRAGFWTREEARSAQLCAYQYDFVCVSCRREASIEFRLHDRQGVAELSRRGRGLEVLARDHFRDVPAVTCLLRRMRVIWLLAFCTAHSFLLASTRPSTFGTLIPAIGALAPVLGLTV